MSNSTPQSRGELLARALHLRNLATRASDTQLPKAAQELAEEYERLAAELEQRRD